MASSNIAKRANGTWLARYRDESGRERTKTFDRKVDGKAWLAEQTAAIQSNTWVDPAAAKQRFRAYATSWQAAQVGAEGTARITDNALRLHILPAIGDRPIGQIVRLEVQSFVKGLEVKGLGPGTIRNVYDVLTRVFSAAVEDRVVVSSPCRKIALPKEVAKKVVPPTLEEVLALRAELPELFQVLPLFLAGTGLRIGEALALDVHDVNWLRAEVAVTKQRLQSGAVAPVKTVGSVDPEVPIPAAVMAALRAHTRTYELDAGPLFPDEFGKPLGYRRWKALFNSARGRAGVDFTTHDLRHFCASAALAGGATIVEVQHLLRHAKASITLDRYSHLVPSSDERVRNALDAALSSASPNFADCLRTGDDVQH